MPREQLTRASAFVATLQQPGNEVMIFGGGSAFSVNDLKAIKKALIAGNVEK